MNQFVWHFHFQNWKFIPSENFSDVKSFEKNIIAQLQDMLKRGALDNKNIYCNKCNEDQEDYFEEN